MPKEHRNKAQHKENYIPLIQFVEGRTRLIRSILQSLENKLVRLAVQSKHKQLTTTHHKPFKNNVLPAFLKYGGVSLPPEREEIAIPSSEEIKRIGIFAITLAKKGIPKKKSKQNMNDERVYFRTVLAIIDQLQTLATIQQKSASITQLENLLLKPLGHLSEENLHHLLGRIEPKTQLISDLFVHPHHDGQKSKSSLLSIPERPNPPTRPVTPLPIDAAIRQNARMIDRLLTPERKRWLADQQEQWLLTQERPTECVEEQWQQWLKEWREWLKELQQPIAWKEGWSSTTVLRGIWENGKEPEMLVTKPSPDVTTPTAIIS